MAEQGFSLTSPDFPNGSTIPVDCTCDGENQSPELAWLNPPEETRSFALIVDDPDAPSCTFTHWVLFDIPAEAKMIPAGVPKMGVGGRNDFQHDHYGGPCPPAKHGEHRYFFKLFALDIESLNLEAGAIRQVVEDAMQDHILATAELMGRFERPSSHLNDEPNREGAH
jgi:Raf kinase inhibitor-like YbhB/YbcL family protein